ncbi:MAG: hypothetical protein ABS35_30800 [Kaistia sp. SCN 65-12]|nr:MAG: hypothetical protein ABS35_30800 [Kaistia sp. SCN 65-12]
MLAPGELIPAEVIEFIGAQLGLHADDLVDYAVDTLASQAGVAFPSRIIWSHRPDDMRICSVGSISSVRRKAIRSVSPIRFDAPGASGAERSQ